MEEVPIPYTGGDGDFLAEGIIIDLDDPTNGRPQECSQTQGPDCEEPWVDISAPEIIEPSIPGPQGGNVLYLDQEDPVNPQGEGLFVILPEITGAWTVEALFLTYDPLFAPAEYNIQNIIGTENAAEQTIQFQLRIFGDGLNGLGVPASGQIQSGISPEALLLMVPIWKPVNGIMWRWYIMGMGRSSDTWTERNLDVQM